MPTIAIYVTWKQLGFYILLYLAALQNVPQGALRGGRRRRGRPLGQVPQRDVAGRTAGHDAGRRSSPIITGSNLFTEPYLLTGGGGPNGASVVTGARHVPTGIEQGDAGDAAAIGVLLVIFVGAGQRAGQVR